MTMINSKKTLTFNSKKKIKVNKTHNNILLKLDYSDIDKRDVYGFYLTNKTTKNNPYELPDIACFANVVPDFIALVSEPSLYNITSKTCVSWFKDDSIFDTIDGLYNAIVYKDIQLLKYYKDRFNGVKIFISPDYSLYGDFDKINILNNLRKQLVVSLWLIFELDAIVIPLMTYSNEESLDWCFEHIMLNSVVAVSLKGIMNEPEKSLFIKALQKLIDSRQPKSLIVYSVSLDKSTKEMLEYAYRKNIDVYIIDNTLLRRNRGDING